MTGHEVTNADPEDVRELLNYKKAYFIGREVWIIERNSWVSTGIDRISLLF